jgi:outer membrane biosynthesis protein TonB
MKRFAVLLVFAAFVCPAPVHAISTSTPSIQKVRFAQESSPVNVVTPPKVLTHPAAAYTDEARRHGIQGDVIVQAYFDADGNITVLNVVKAWAMAWMRVRSQQ